MHIKTPRLYVNRCGVFYFRVKTAAADRRVSLRTKCPQTAAIIALGLNANLERKRAMTKSSLFGVNLDPEALRQYEIDIKNGVFKATGKEDSDLMASFLKSQGIDLAAIESLMKAGNPAPMQVAAAAAEATPTRKSEPMIAAVDKWLANSRGKNVARTVDAKAYHIKDFLIRNFAHVETVDRWLAENEKEDSRKRKALRAVDEKVATNQHAYPNIEVNAIDKALLVEYKNTLLAVPQTPKTIDNKLQSLHDFFKYMLGHGLYTAFTTNPVDGLFIEDKAARKKNTKSYEPFTTEALKIFFESSAYLAKMDAPDLFWGPLLGIYTGMRISEVTQIRCIDVHHAQENGVDYIHVYKSKTPGGIRNVPICDALIGLGFLDYVAECRAAGAERIFPHRALINHGYSKDLSATMLAYQKGRKIKAPQTSFHSFRVNVITQMHNNNANAGKIMKIVGHENGEGNAVHWGYVRDLPDLKPIVDALSWPIDLASIKYNGCFKAFVSSPQNWA